MYPFASMFEKLQVYDRAIKELNIDRKSEYALNVF